MTEEMKKRCSLEQAYDNVSDVGGIFLQLQIFGIFLYQRGNVGNLQVFRKKHFNKKGEEDPHNNAFYQSLKVDRLYFSMSKIILQVLLISLIC